MNEKIIGRLIYEDIPFKYDFEYGYIILENCDNIWEIDFPDSIHDYRLFVNNELFCEIDEITEENLDVIIKYIWG